MKKSIDQMAREIEAVPENQDDPPNLKAALWAIEQWDKNNKDLTTEGEAKGVPGAGVSRSPKDTNKCSLFVAHAFGVGGEIGWFVTHPDGRAFDRAKRHSNFSEDGYPLTYDKDAGAFWPIIANVLGSENDSLPNFTDTRDIRLEGSLPAQTGDIISFPNPDPSQQGHATIAIGSDSVIYSSTSSIKFVPASDVYPNRPANTRTYDPNQ